MQVILLHSFWRSSSTYFWSKLRNLPNVKAFYEPFHELLQGSIKNKNLVVDSCSWNSRHPKEDNYFREIISAYHQQNIMFYPGFTMGWPEVGAGDLSSFHVEHLNNLLTAPCPDGVDTLVFSFNRSMFNISHLHEIVERCFPGRVHSFVFFRSPCQQISSYLSQSATGNLYFESRFYGLWFACPRLVDLLNFDWLSDVSSGLTLDKVSLEETLKSMSAHEELSAFLYALTVVDSLFKSLELWSIDRQDCFLAENVFYIDEFNHSLCSRDRMESKFRELGVSLSLDDFNLPLIPPHVDFSCIKQAFSCAIKLLMGERKQRRLPSFLVYFLSKTCLNLGFSSFDEEWKTYGSEDGHQMSLFKRKVASQLEDFVVHNKKIGFYGRLQKQTDFSSYLSHENHVVRSQLQEQLDKNASLADEISRLSEKVEILALRNNKLQAMLDASEYNFAKMIRFLRPSK